MDEPLHHLLALADRTADPGELAAALASAERHEPGFAWRFAAYLRDPERGRGDALLGTLIAAILASQDPAGPHTEEYVFRCLRHAAKDAIAFVAHFTDAALGRVSEAARRGMGRAFLALGEEALLDAARQEVPLASRPGRTVRLVDALGIARQHLGELRRIEEYLHAPTRDREKKAAAIPLVAVRRAFFRAPALEGLGPARLPLEAFLSAVRSTPEVWQRLLDAPGVLDDAAFVRYARKMSSAGIPLAVLLERARKRSFAGLGLPEIYAAYRAVMSGRRAAREREAVWIAPPTPELAPLFELILEQASASLPQSALGIVDASGSMFGARLAGRPGRRSRGSAADAAVIVSALLARGLGYAATFDDDVYFADRGKEERAFDFAAALGAGRGTGSTQVAAPIVGLLRRLLEEPLRPRPRTLVFFSDLPFHPPELQALPPGRQDALHELGIALDPAIAPLEAVLRAFRARIGPLEVVLWDLARSVRGALPSALPGVRLLAGFDVGAFSALAHWQAAGSPVEPAGVSELDRVRSF
jgi:hypothetical protein